MTGLPPAYPVNLLVAGKSVLVVGGGTVAAGKVRGLVEVGAVVTVVAPDVVDEITQLPGVAIERRPYERGEVARYRLVVAATGVPAVSQAVFDDAEAAGVWVNSADDPERCTFTLPARVRRGEVLVTVSTGGRSPAVAAWLRERLEADLDPALEVLVEVVADERDRLRAEGVATEGLNWREALRSGMLDRIREGDLVGARELLRTCLSSSSA
ncbi:MAG: bifunctional precorrin-2 dehydrogenase/sirohydrochlorin ferrochelatase [Actinomycetota bacterium]|nr:bifunctional precorrin-2 dehydrogenase/sirohydrochlorin ferrochelatase [Acidimicrobiia bacterium]MDQ3294417.1 bifunctional precorrin-2 dehydrogenase/sirohydrochlorin ferrochelatase [Actinomycetota bacterium]